MQIASSEKSGEGNHVLGISAPNEVLKNGFAFGAVILGDAEISLQNNRRYGLSTRVRRGAKFVTGDRIKLWFAANEQPMSSIVETPRFQ